jgi:hypothetical protein
MKQMIEKKVFNKFGEIIINPQKKTWGIDAA